MDLLVLDLLKSEVGLSWGLFLNLTKLEDGNNLCYFFTLL